MQKHILYVFTALLLLSSCSSRDKANTIVGGLAVDYAGKTIYISKVLPSKKVLVDSALVDTVGNFAFRLSLGDPDFFEISDKPKNSGIVFIASPSEQIEVGLPRGSAWISATVKGASGFSNLKALDDSLSHFRGRLNSIQKQFDTLKYSYRYDSLRRALKVSFNDQIIIYRNFLRGFIVQNKGSLTSIPALYQRFDSVSYMLNDKKDLNYFLMVDSILFRKYPSSDMVKAFHLRMQTIRYQLNNRKLNNESVAEGSFAHEFMLKSLDGDTVSLVKLRGRYVLLCFWASWAKTSVAENKGLIEIHKKYKPYGFEIVQVSLDRNLGELTRSLTPEMRQWKHCSEFKMWNSSVVKDYRVSCIPSNFIINRQGIVVARNVLGKSLFDTLRWYLVRPYLMRRDTTATKPTTVLENTSDQ